MGEFDLKPYERRESGKTSYFKLAFFNDVIQCWQDTPAQFNSVEDLMGAARQFGPGRYRVSRVTVGPSHRGDAYMPARTDLHEFEVLGD